MSTPNYPSLTLSLPPALCWRISNTLCVLASVLTYISPVWVTEFTGRLLKHEPAISSTVSLVTALPAVILVIASVWTLGQTIGKQTPINILRLAFTLTTAVQYVLYSTQLVPAISADSYGRAWRVGSYLDLVCSTTCQLLAIMQVKDKIELYAILARANKSEQPASSVKAATTPRLKQFDAFLTFSESPNKILLINFATWLLGGIAHLTYTNPVRQYALLISSCITTTYTLLTTEALLQQLRNYAIEQKQPQFVKHLWYITVYHWSITVYFVLAFGVASNLHLVSNQTELIIYCIGDVVGRIALNELLRRVDDLDDTPAVINKKAQ